MAKSGNMPAMGSGLSELWARLRFVLLAIVVYRIGAHIPVPGINPDQLAALFRSNRAPSWACSTCSRVAPWSA